MALFDQISGLLGNVLNGNLSEQETHDHYDQISQAVPQHTLGSIIGPALGGLGSGQVQQSVANSAGQMSTQQKGDFVGTLLKGLGGANLGGLLGQLGIDPGVAQNPQAATPEEVGKLASHAQSTNPDLFHKATEFYAQHPTLVKALGAVVIEQIATRLSRGMP